MPVQLVFGGLTRTAWPDAAGWMRTVSGCWRFRKVAPTYRPEFTSRVQVGAFPAAAHGPDQPWKKESAPGVAVRVTTLSNKNCSKQSSLPVPEQEMPPAFEVTVPVPILSLVTVSEGT